MGKTYERAIQSLHSLSEGEKAHSGVIPLHPSVTSYSLQLYGAHAELRRGGGQHEVASLRPSSIGCKWRHQCCVLACCAHTSHAHVSRVWSDCCSCVLVAGRCRAILIGACADVTLIVVCVGWVVWARGLYVGAHAYPVGTGALS